MEIPKKIYVHEASAPELTENLPYHIEYTRTDAFIEKACEWMKQNVVDYLSDTGVGIVFDEWNGIEDFKKYMKGE